MGTALNIAYCHSLIRISQALSRSDKSLSTVRCLHTGAKSVIRTVGELDTELDDVKAELNNSFGLHLGQRIRRERLPTQINLEQLVYLQYAYSNAKLNAPE